MNRLLMLFAVLGERLGSGIEQASDLLTNRTGFVGELIMSESGRVNPEKGFRLAWAAGVIVTAMVVLGSPPQAAAHPYCLKYTVSCVHDAMCLQYCMVHLGCHWGECFGKCFCL